MPQIAFVVTLTGLAIFGAGAYLPFSADARRLVAAIIAIVGIVWLLDIITGTDQDVSAHRRLVSPGSYAVATEMTSQWSVYS